jgi:hypothetical protein
MDFKQDITQEELDYEIELANHANFYQKQKDVAVRLEKAIRERYYNVEDETDFDLMVSQEVRKEIARLNESEAMGRPNKPGYYRANDD